MSKRRAFIPDEIRDEIKARASADIVGLADYFLLGEYPRRKETSGGVEYSRHKASRRTWKVTASGKYAGWVKDWRGHNRDAIGLVCDQMGCGFIEALQWLADRYGISLSDDLTAEERAKRSEEYRAREAQRQAERERQREQQERIDRAAHEAAEIMARAIVERLPAATSHPYAERKHVTPRTALYAAETITGRLYNRGENQWRDHATAARAGDLVIPMQNASGRIINVQKITPDGTKRFLLGGKVEGAFHVIPGIEPGLLVEGYATGLTVAEATGRAVFVAFDAGNLGAVAEIVRPRLCAVAADNDESRTGENKARATGLPFLMPPTVGHDWNDHTHGKPRTAKEGEDSEQDEAGAGLEDTAARLAEITRTLPGGCPDAMAARGVPLVEAEARLTPLMTQWLEGARAYHAGLPEGYAKAKRIEREAASKEGRQPDENRFPLPPAYLLKVSTGAGKSRATLDAIAGALREGKVAGSVAFACPTVKLAQEQAEAFRKIAPGIACRVYLGRDQFDPDDSATDPQTGNPWKMCRNISAMKCAQDLGLSVTESVCDAKKADEAGQKAFVCPFREQCGYRKQKAAEGVRVWFAAHACLFTGRPSCMSDLALLAIDETIEGAAIDTSTCLLPNAKGWVLPDWLQEESRKASLSTVLGMRRGDAPAHIRSALIPGILAANGNGLLTLDTLIGQGLTARDLQGYIEAERTHARNHLLPDAERYNSADKTTRQQESERASCGKVSGRIIRFLLECKRLFDDSVPVSGRIEVLPTKAEGEPHSARLRRASSVHDGFKVPTIILSATASETLLRHRFPNLTHLGDVTAAAPFMHIEQDISTAWGKSRFFNMEDGKSNQRAFRSAMARIRREIAPHRRALLVAQQGIIEGLRTHAATTPGGWPSNLDTAHFNAVSGLNAWGPGPGVDGVDRVIILGRVYPDALEIEAMAEALTGEPIERIERDGNKPTFYPKKAARYLMADGSSREVEDKRQHHPDETANALLHSSMTGELVQAIGRARGVRRTEANPCRVLVMSDVPLPLPINELIEDASRAPDIFEEMASVGGIVCESGTDAGRLYHGTIWGNPEDDTPGDIDKASKAARTAFERARKDRQQANPQSHIPYGKDYIIGNVADWNDDIDRPVIGNVPNLAGFTYQKAGARQRPARAWFDRSRLTAEEARERMEAALGPLARFDVDGVPDGVAVPLVAAAIRGEDLARITDSNGAGRVSYRDIPPPPPEGVKSCRKSVDGFRIGLHMITDSLGIEYDDKAEAEALRVVASLSFDGLAGKPTPPPESVSVAVAFDAMERAGKDDLITYALDHLSSDSRDTLRKIMIWPGKAKRSPGQTRLEWISEHYSRDLPAWVSALSAPSANGRALTARA